jgi:hypothetical protein
MQIPDVEGPDGKSLGRTSLHYAWRKTVEDYSATELTKWTDRVPALLGLATELGVLLDTEYLVGIWLNDIKGLLWGIDGTQTSSRIHPKIFGEEPSWSWSSYQAPITYRYTHVACGTGNAEGNAPTAPQILETSIVPVGIDLKGSCISCFIRLFGRMRKVNGNGRIKENEIDTIPHGEQGIIWLED